MHLTETQINDLIDDALDPAEAADVGAHLDSCAQCSAVVAGLRELTQRLSALPLSVPPERDLRANIWTQADRRTLWHWRYPLAAAAILLIGITSTLTVLFTRGGNEPVVHVTETTGSVDLVSLESQYSTEVETLERTLKERREELSPETVRILEENLAIIDKAIREARTALVNDPQSDMLGELLRSAYQRKLDLLKQAARSSAET